MPSNRQSLHKLILASLTISVSFALPAFAQDPQREEPQPPRIIRKSGGVLQGSATRRVEPVYPPLARAARVSGSVVVEVTVDEEGSVFSARAISGHPLLKDVAVSAARGWKFSPTTLQGVPVKVIGTLTFNFRSVSKEEIEALKEKVAATPDSVELHYRLAELYRLDDQHDAAIAEYKVALTLEPDYVQAHIGLGEAYHAVGRYDEAIETFNQGLRVNAPASFLVRLNLGLGLSYVEQGRNEEALGVFKLVISADPDSVEGHYNLGLTYLKLGDKQSALNEYNILKDLSEGRAEALRRSLNKNP